MFQCYLTKIHVKPSESLLRILDFRSCCCLSFPKRLVQLLMNFKISTSLISDAYKLLLMEYNKCMLLAVFIPALKKKARCFALLNGTFFTKNFQFLHQMFIIVCNFSKSQILPLNFTQFLIFFNLEQTLMRLSLTFSRY